MKRLLLLVKYWWTKDICMARDVMAMQERIGELEAITKDRRNWQALHLDEHNRASRAESRALAAEAERDRLRTNLTREEAEHEATEKARRGCGPTCKKNRKTAGKER